MISLKPQSSCTYGISTWAIIWVSTISFGSAQLRRIECPKLGGCENPSGERATSGSYHVKCCRDSPPVSSDASRLSWHLEPGCDVWGSDYATNGDYVTNSSQLTKNTFQYAQDFCTFFHGARLCTTFELRSNCASGDQLQHYFPVWASTGESNCHSWVGSAGRNREIKIGFMGPYNSPAGGINNQPTLPAAFLAAVEWLNYDPTHLFPFGGACGSNVTIVPVMKDSSRVGSNSKVRALRNADRLFKCTDSPGGTGTCSAEAFEGENVDIVIADQFSSTVTVTGMMAEIHESPMVGYGATSDALSNKQDFPYFSRSASPDRHQAPYLAKMVAAFGWTHVAVLNGDGSYASNLAAVFTAACTGEGVNVEERHTFAEGTTDAWSLQTTLRTIKSAGVKIIVLMSAEASDTLFVFRQAEVVGMTGEGFTWIGTDGWMSASEFKGETNNLKHLARGTIGVFPFTATPNSSEGSITSSGMSALVNDLLYGPSSTSWRRRASAIDPEWNIPELEEPYDMWGHYVFDATIHAARAAAYSSQRCFLNGTCLQEEIRKFATLGATGSLHMERQTGDRSTGDYTILNVQPDNPLITVPVGSIHDGVVEFNANAIIWSSGQQGGEIPSDGEWSAKSETVTDTDLAVGLGLGFGIPILLLLIFLYFYRQRKQRQIKKRKVEIEAERQAKLEQMALASWERQQKENERAQKEQVQKELNALRDSMQAMMEVKTAWTGPQNVCHSDTSPGARIAPETQVIWYWKEDPHNMHLHMDKWVKKPFWVMYDNAIAEEIETKFVNWKNGTGSNSFHTDLTGHIGSTGTGAKGHKADSGYKYVLRFDTMCQINSRTGFEREILRTVSSVASSNLTGVPPKRSILQQLTGILSNVSHPTSMVDVDVDYGSNNNPQDWTSANSNVDVDSDSDDDPLDWTVEDYLPLAKGQLIQVQRRRQDGYFFGIVMYGPSMDESGWFPGNCLTQASSGLISKFQASIGGAGADALAVPSTWTSQNDQLHAHTYVVSLTSQEAIGKITQFMCTMPSSVQIISLERIQNIPMWQSYAVKRITMMNRSDARDNWERPVLFHGTDESTAKKIMQQGFNRNFSGLNATLYGKGVYFARDARYSSSKSYARPNYEGVQTMFLCRVMVGEYCEGRADIKTPDVLDNTTHRLYDTTVDSVSDPRIFVTYHDAQVYPEYLIKFRQN